MKGVGVAPLREGNMQGKLEIAKENRYYEGEMNERHIRTPEEDGGERIT